MDRINLQGIVGPEWPEVAEGPEVVDQVAEVEDVEAGPNVQDAQVGPEPRLLNAAVVPAGNDDNRLHGIFGVILLAAGGCWMWFGSTTKLR